MNNITKSTLIACFWAGLADWDWESWQSAGAEDKEDIVTDAIVALGHSVDIDEAYDLFWEWAEGLDEDSFSSGYSQSLSEDINNKPKRKYKVTYQEYDGGPKKSFTIQARTWNQAKQISWLAAQEVSEGRAEAVWVTELVETP